MDSMVEIVMIAIVLGVAATGILWAVTRHWIFRKLHSPAEICERYGHENGHMTETCGRGSFGVCEMCGAPVYEHEWS